MVAVRLPVPADLNSNSVLIQLELLIVPRVPRVPHVPNNNNNKYKNKMSLVRPSEVPLEAAPLTSLAWMLLRRLATCVPSPLSPRVGAP